MEQQKLQIKKSKSDPSGAAAGLALVEAITYLKREWDFSSNEISEILHIPASTINTWISKKNIPISQPLAPDIQTILQLISIHRNLEAMFERTEHQLAWLNTTHPDMGRPPYDVMKSSVEGLIGVRQYLDYARGRGA